MTPVELPGELAGVTAEWLSAALSQDRPGTRVATVRRGAPTVRFAAGVPLAVTYAANPAGLPEALYLKTTLGLDVGRLRAAAARETRFYTEFARTVPVRVPECFFAATDDRTGHSVLVLADLSGAARFGDPRRPLGVAELRDGLAQLALLHAAWWDAPPAGVEPYPGDLRPVVLGLLAGDGWRRALDRPAGSLVPQPLRSPALVVEATERMWRLQDGQAVTVLHGDPHLGNTYTGVDGRLGFLDWQALSAGPYAYDVTRSLVGSASVAVRRRYERELLLGYLEALRRLGVAQPPTPTEAWTAYRRNVLHGLRFLCTPPGTYPEAAIEAYVRRCVAAAEDLQALAALGL